MTSPPFEYPVPLFLTAILLSVSCACVPADDKDARTIWLQNTLIQDNQALIEREPVLTGGKFLKMASTPYNYFRGTQSQFLRDMAQPGPGHIPSAFADAAGSRVLLLGDPHIENIGSYKTADGELVIDFNDHDAAAHGPWIYDLRRLALSAWMLGQAIDDPELPMELVRQVALGYRAEIGVLQAGGEPIAIRRTAGFGAIYDDLIRRAERDGDISEELDEYTRVEDGVRTMFFGTIDERVNLAIIEDEVVPVSEAELKLVKDALALYPQTLETPVSEGQMALKGVSRRLGAGVSSYPVLRFYALIEGPTESLDDDVLLELKEINDPGSLPGLRLYPGLSHRFNAERVVEHQRLLQETTQNDPYLGWAAVGPISFRVRHRTKYQKGVSVGRIVEKLEEGDLVTEDLATLAHTAGRLLARSHALAPTLTGEPGLGVIAQTLNKNPDALAPEIEDFVETYGPLTQADHSRLLSLIDNEGELLGYRGH